jgi:polyribonucleotide nucleotidyltransferase
MGKVTEKFELYGQEYTLETGELAKQAGGAVLVRQGDSVVLVTGTASREPKDLDFFPLTVDFEERMYAAGRLPGGFIKRESRPSEKAILTARMIDRPIRSAFADGFRNDVQVIVTALSADQEHQIDVISIMGASAALMAAGIPFEGPLAGVRISRDESGEFLVNPTFDDAEASDLDLVVAGSRDAIYMVEAGANEVSEEDMLAALTFAQEAIGEFCAVQERFLAKLDITPMDVKIDEPPADLRDRIFSEGAEKMKAALHNPDKHARMDAVAAVKEELKGLFDEAELSANAKHIKGLLKALEKKTMREMVLEEGERADGRGLTEIRPITCAVDYLPTAHGTGLFTRGQTQVLSVLTLGMLNEWQRLDTIDVAEGKRYIHHYNFPPFCTGETGFMRGPKRRDIGHGALAERALLPMVPAEEDFPYTIRIVSEVLESNGSSSMASVCGSTLALMDAGVPIKAPVAGIAMGLIKESDRYAVLSDIQGLEDFLGDMDFKVAGTEAGITALQMDNKAKGLSVEILSEALRQAKEGRAHILGKMLDTLDAPRQDLKDYAPRIITIKIPTDKIRDVIGPGGKVIKGLVEETGADIDVNDDGTIYVAARDARAIEAVDRIKAIVRDVEPGEKYTGRVVSIQPFGAFIELIPGKDGLLHISKMAKGRIAQVESVLNIGDEVEVIVQEIDDRGKVSLDLIEKFDVPEGAEAPAPRRDDRGDRGGHSGDRKPRRRH